MPARRVGIAAETAPGQSPNPPALGGGAPGHGAGGGDGGAQGGGNGSFDRKGDTSQSE